MSPEFRRSLRIQELTKMALAGKKLDAIYTRAYEMAARKTADEYVAEVIRRVKK